MTFIQQGCIKCIKSDCKGINVMIYLKDKYFDGCFCFKLSIQRILEKKYWFP